MTEQEAKTKWCPMLQVSAATGVLGTVSNRSNAFDDNSDRHGRCIGSACMAWRTTYSATLTDQSGNVRRVGAGAMYDMSRETLGSELVGGFCGLAGKP